MTRDGNGSAMASFRADDAALLGAVGILLGVLVAGTLGTAGYLYATDYGLKADVTGKDCAVPVVSVKTHAFGLRHDVLGVTLDQCHLLTPGDHVTYHLRSKHTILYDSDGECVYDSETGPCGSGVPPLSRAL